MNREQHGGRSLKHRDRWPFSARLNAVYLTVNEFFRAGRDYPIAFIHEAGPDLWLPVAVMGLEKDQNLFADDHGVWRENAYVPAYVRRYPFCTVQVRPEGQEGNVLICVDEAGLKDKGETLFDRKGRPSKEWERLETLIQDMEAARKFTERFCAGLHELGLLEPFEAHARPREGEPKRLRGMYRVNETRLNALPADTIKGLMNRGELSRIYAHLLSLDNFAILLDLHQGATVGS